MSLRPILQVDDEESDAFLLQTVFAEAAIDNPVHIARDGQEAIDYLEGNGIYADRTAHPLPCIVLLDIKLPKKSGLEVLEWIRGRPELRHVIVILLSSSALPSDVRRGYALGVNSFVEKPVDYERAVQMTHAFKRWWLEFNQFTTECG